MRTSEQINELATALAKAQAEMKNAAMTKTNPHFKSKYADLASIRDAIVPALSKNGIAVVQSTQRLMEAALDGVILDKFILVITTLIHSSGQWLQGEYPIPNDPSKPQIMGSALTYARRYSLAAICGIAAEEDDDANAAHTNGTEKPTYPKARSREPFAKLETEMRKITDLDKLDEWWGKSDIAEAKARLPLDWQIDLFISFLKHGLKISESRNAQHAFFWSYEEAITNGITDDEKRNDLLETYKEAQAAWLTL